MYKSHSQFQALSDPNATIWKYMDIFKYLTILQREELFLQRVDKYQDKYDGFMPTFRNGDTLNGSPLNPEMIQGLNDAYNQTRQYAYANCWTLNEHESSLMWDCYSNKLGGVAIKSTLQRLCDSVIDGRDIYVNPVKYDFPNIELGNIYFPLLSKRPQFNDEKEVRLFYTDLEGVKPNAKKNLVDHIYIKVNLDTLIESAFFHPATPDWMLETLTAVISKYKTKVPIKSMLYSNTD